MSNLEKKMFEIPLHIGMRKVKTLLSIVTGFLVWQLFRLVVPGLTVHPYFTYIYSMLEVRESSEKTREMSGRRLKVTIIGLLLGFAFLILTDYLTKRISLIWIKTVIELALILLGVLLTLVIAESAGCKTSCGLTAIVFIVVVVSHTTEDIYFYALQRLVQTLVGLFSAWLINVKIFPYPRKKA